MRAPEWPSCLLVITYLTSAVNTAHSGTHPDMGLRCMLDEDQLNPELTVCLEKGSRYLDRYLTELRWRATRFDKCREINEFRDCFRPLLQDCPSIRRIHSDWATVLDKIECSCNNSTDTCNSELHCFEEQSSGPLVKGCDAYYRFNVDQRTRDRCHFTAENIHCKEALMTSGCGESVGDFAFALYQVASEKRSKKHSCDISREATQPVFTYSEECPVEFPTQVEQCRQQHLLQNKLDFHKDNDLIALGRKSDIKDACRSYRQYRTCVRPIKTSCRKGLNLLYDYDGRLRTYLKKMDYICGDDKQDYVHHLPCYRDVLRAERMAQCDDTWALLQSLLGSVTSHTFYCRERSNESIHLQIVLDELGQCYESVFRKSCGREGGNTLGRLMRNVLEDPFYLRYKYKPDCKLHRNPPDTRVRSFRLSSTTPHGEHSTQAASMAIAASAALVPKNSIISILGVLLTLIYVLNAR